MWSHCVWTLSSLLLYITAIIATHSPDPSPSASVFSEGLLRTTVTPVRVDHKGHPYPRQQQFRRRGQHSWPGTVRYQVRIYNRTWVLDLHLHYRTPHRHRHRHWPHPLKVFDSSSLEVKEYIKERCYYTGKVIGQSDSFVGVSLCAGMTGDIHSSLGSYVIHPLLSESKGISEEPWLHSVSPLVSPDPRRPWRPLNATGIAFCGVQNDEPNGVSQNSMTSSMPSGETEMFSRSLGMPLKRKRRSESRELHLEVLVVADSKMAHYHGNNLRHYILTLMSTVALIYKDPSIGNNINIAVVDITTLDESVDYDVIHTVAPTTLRKFCNWQQKHNSPDDRDPTHHDAAILITREDLCRYPGACDTLGLAQSGMMCDPYSSCAIVEDNGLSAAFTIAHELGHVMSIPHDDDKKCSRYHDEKKKLHVMARMLDYNSHPWSWSQCSRHYLTSFFDVGYGHCLVDRPSRNLLQQDEEFQQPPGQLYSRDRQCQLVFGPNSRICPYMPECKRLWCTMDDGTQGGCRTQHMPWADGTQCTTGKHCYQGECVRVTPTRLTPVDGQWGLWKPYGKCSRTCGGGVQQAVRECDFPKPENGGRYCIGIRIKYKPCNTQNCPAGSRDFRELQCEEFNGRRLPGLPAASRWVPYYVDISPTDQCKLYCKVARSQTYFMLREKVVDGTPCSPTSFDICVNGNCEPAGCDHVLGSNKTLDRCGVCGGANRSCREISGQFDKTVDYGYHDVVMLPPGASNIQIKQHSPNNETDDNYIALRDPEKNYILNGDYMISMFPKTLQYHGTIIDYSGSDSVIEQLNTTKPLKRDLYVQVLIVGNLQPPQITFSYTVPLSDSNLYSWQLAPSYSECSKMCNGISYRKPICVRQSDLHPVNEGHCPELPKPRIEHRKPCNQNCTLEWQDVSKSECSVQCGRGVRQRIIKCMKVDIETKVSHVVPEDLCSDFAPKPVSREECLGTCLNSTWVFAEWSPCSTTCDHGIQQRTAECRNNQNEIQPDSHCPPEGKITEKPCYFGPCPHWAIGEWTKCSVSCGIGERQRPYWCHLKGKVVASRYCNSQMIPIHIEVCKQPPCAQWKTGEWKTCSSSCGQGVTRREVYCFRPDGGDADDNLCASAPKPKDKDECSLGPCQQRSIGHFYNTWKKRPIPSMSLLKDPKKKWPELNEGSVSNSDYGIWKSGEWSKCSDVCGKGHRTRTVTCHHPEDDSRMPLARCDEFEKPKDQEICEAVKCAEWTTEPWSQCLCEIGLKHRTVKCSDETAFCDPNNKPHLKEDCTCAVHIRHHNIHRWKTGPWGECSTSTTCGEGTKYRLVACVNGQGQPVDGSKCPESPPTDSEKCIVRKCPTWQWSDWSECSASCGNGTKSRKPYCDHLDENECNSSEQPDPEIRICSSERRCRQTVRWRKGSWSRCSEACGNGYKTREVVCIDNRRRRTDPRYCSEMEKPHERKRCFLKPCALTWITGPWSECSRACDDGIQTRTVTCHRVNAYGWIDPEPAPTSESIDEWCNLSTQPRYTKICNYGSCDKGYVWRPGDWLDCSGKCGKEKQKRKVRCYNYEGEKVARKLCNNKQKPQRKRPCNMHPSCKPQNCYDIQRMQRTRSDGNYTIYIKGKEITVYCRAMNTAEPQSYITLVDNSNYAQIYSTDSRSDTYEQCDSGTEMPECDCDRPDEGFTRFTKVAFNTTTLRIILDDFTFSETFYGNPVPFATAGDCFKGTRCPQGKFLISLLGTGLRISDQTSWTYKKGYLQSTVHMTEGGQFARGICGGYCGTCIPDRKYGLLLEIVPP